MTDWRRKEDSNPRYHSDCIRFMAQGALIWTINIRLSGTRREELLTFNDLD